MEEFHIGHLIRKELRRQEKTNRWFAEQINVNPRTVNKIFQKTAQNFPSSKEKSFSSKEKFPTSKEKNPSSKEVFRRKVTKKGGQHSPPLTLCKYTSFFSEIQICISRHFYKS